MRKIGYMLLGSSLVMVCVGVYGWILHACTLAGIVLSMWGRWRENR